MPTVSLPWLQIHVPSAYRGKALMAHFGNGLLVPSFTWQSQCQPRQDANSACQQGTLPSSEQQSTMR